MSSRNKRKQPRQGAQANPSTGPKSPAGIQISSKNALKHGLTSKMIVLSNESHAKFDELHQSYIQDFHPTNRIEMDLIDQMVAAQWRLHRIWLIQTAALDLKMDMQEAEIKKTFQQIDQPTRLSHTITTMANEGKSLELLLRYETTYTRIHQRALNTLLRLRREIAVDPDTSEELRNEPPPPPEPPSEQEEFSNQLAEMTPEQLVELAREFKIDIDTLKPEESERT